MYIRVGLFVTSTYRTHAKQQSIRYYYFGVFVCVAGTRVRIQPEVQGGQVHNRNGTHDQRKRLGEPAEEMNSYRLSIHLSISLSFPPCVYSLVKYLFVFSLPAPFAQTSNSSEKFTDSLCPTPPPFFRSSDREKFDVFPDNPQWSVLPTVAVYTGTAINVIAELWPQRRRIK